MKIRKQNWHVTLVDLIVGLAVLMVLSALVIPLFVPPNGHAASRTGAPHASTKPARH